MLTVGSESLNGEAVLYPNANAQIYGFQENLRLEDGEECVLSAIVELDRSASDQGNFDLLVSWGRVFSSTFETLFEEKVRIEDCDGLQTVVVRVSSYMANAGNPYVGCAFSTPSGHNAKIKITEVKLSKVGKAIETDCLSVSTGGAIYTEKNGANGADVSWYELTRCSFGNNSNVKMTGVDWLRTLESYAKNSSDYIVWWDDLAHAERRTGNTLFTFKSGSHYINTIRYAKVSERNTRLVFEYNAYGGTYKVVTTQNTVFSDGASKKCYLRYDNYYRLSETEDSEGAVTTYTYDTYGNMTREKITADGKSIIYDSVYGDENGAASGGKYLVEEKDYLGINTNIRKYRYNAATGDMTSDISPEDLTTSYAYKANGEPESIKATVDNAENAHIFNYDDKGRLNKVDYNGMSYVFTYNNKNEVTEVTAQYKKGGGTYIDTLMSKQYWHTAKDDTVETQTGENAFVERQYDVYGRLIAVDEMRNSDSGILKNIYGATKDNVTNVTSPTDTTLTINADSKIRKRIDNDRTAVYTYDSKGNLTKVERTDGLTLEYVYDTDGRQTGHAVKLNNAAQVLSVTYENGDALNGDRIKSSKVYTSSCSFDTTDGYDGFGRLKTRGRDFSVSDLPLTVELTDGYEYAAGSGNGTTTEKPATITHTLNLVGATEAITLPTESFGYDANGNITSIKRSDGEVKYTYDNLNRLTREDNERLGKTWTYAYDAGGNIKSKLEYAYTTGTLGSVTKDYGIVYDETRKDNLKKFDDKSFAYSKHDGFPTTYKGESLEWNHRRLYTYGSTTYTYDADNVRRTKTGNGTTTTYYYDGTRLMAEKRGTKVIRYMYDHSGLTGIIIDGAPYIYAKNALGDITGLYNNYGGLVASYAYDAWGNCTVYTGSGALDSTASSIGNKNPFRYRGYYYDVETKLYYLINRYYDPEVGRFISPDHIGYMLEQMEQLNGCNLYAYCLNNPVMHTDPEGTFFWFFVIAGAIVGAVMGAMKAYDAAKEAGMDTVGVAGATILGGLGGGILGGIIGLFAGFGFGGGLGALVGGGTAFVGATATASVAVITATTFGATAISTAALLGNYVYKQSKPSKKEKSTDKPSWVNKDMIDPNKNATENAIDLMNKKYGEGNWNSRLSEFSRIKKYVQRDVFRYMKGFHSIINLILSILA